MHVPRILYPPAAPEQMMTLRGSKNSIVSGISGLVVHSASSSFAPASSGCLTTGNKWALHFTRGDADLGGDENVDDIPAMPLQRALLCCWLIRQDMLIAVCRHHSFVPGNKLFHEIIRNNNDDNKVVNAVGFVSLLGI